MKKLDIDKYIAESIMHFKLKANHNKSEALWSYRLIMLCSVSIPLLISLSDNFIVGKVIPAILSMIVTLATAWLQKRQPDKLWKLYRSCQRKIENEVTLYQYDIEDYDNENKDKVLIKNITDIKTNAHNSWEMLVPVPDSNGKNKNK